MLYAPKIDDSEGFCSIGFSEYSKSIREKFYSKLSEEQNI